MPGGNGKAGQIRSQGGNRAVGAQRQDLGKGFALSGVVTRSGPANGVRVRFDGMAPSERDSLRQFLKFVQDTTRASQSESIYLQLLK